MSDERQFNLKNKTKTCLLTEHYIFQWGKVWRIFSVEYYKVQNSSVLVQ